MGGQSYGIVGCGYSFCRPADKEHEAHLLTVTVCNYISSDFPAGMVSQDPGGWLIKLPRWSFGSSSEVQAIKYIGALSGIRLPEGGAKYDYTVSRGSSRHSFVGGLSDVRGTR